MKAIQLTAIPGIDHLPPVVLADPGEPGHGQIRVRLHASSLNYHDLSVVNGTLKAAPGRIPLSDGAGTVEAVGAGVTDFVVGDAVVSTFFPTWLDGAPSLADFSTTPGDGVDGYAREVVVTAAQAFTHAPRGYSHVQAATLTTAGLTAWRALVVDGNLQAGSTVLVLGTGGVSIFALQIAKSLGATVIITSSSDDKLQRAKALGADHLINYRRDEQWAARVMDITAGRGVDHVVEVGGPGTLGQSILSTRVGGHIALIGVLTGVSGAIPTAALVTRQIRLQGVVVGSRMQQQDMVHGLAARGIHPVIDHTFALDDIAEAFRLQQSGAHFGKIVLEF